MEVVENKNSVPIPPDFKYPLIVDSLVKLNYGFSITVSQSVICNCVHMLSLGECLLE